MRDRRGPSGPFSTQWSEIELTLPALVEGGNADITGVVVNGVSVNDEVAGFPHTGFLANGHFLLGITPTAPGQATVSVGNYTTTSISELTTTLNVEVKKKT
jgi:hypothetical protein